MATPLARFLAAPVLVSSLVAAQSNRLNGPLPRAPRNGRVTHHLVSADGTRIVYRADKRASSSYELFSVPLDGSAPSIRLNDRLRPGASVVPDDEEKAMALASGDRVVYLLDRGVDDVREVHVVPLDGSASPTRVTPAGFDVAGFWVTPDAVLFRGEGLDLFRVPLAGGTPVNIAFNRFVDRVWVAPGGATTVFSARRDATSQFLLRVPTDGSALPVQLDASESQSAKYRLTYFDHVGFAPDGVHVLYDEVLEITDGETNHYELRSAALDGSHPTLSLSQTTFYDGGYAFDPAPGSGRVAFKEGGLLNACAFDGTGFATLATGVSSDEQLPILVHGAQVFFDDQTGADQALYSVPIDGSQPAAALMAPTPIDILSFARANFARVAFIARDPTTFRGLYAVSSAGGGTPLLLNPPAGPGTGAQELAVEPGGQALVFSAQTAPSAPNELYRVPVDGSATPVLLTASLALQPTDLAVPTSAHVVFRGWQAAGGQGVYGAPLDGLGPVIQYNEPLLSDVVVGDVTGFAATPDGSTVVYRADQEADESFDLYAAHPSGLGLAVRLTALLPGAPLVLPGFVLSPAGDRVVFQSSVAGEFTLWSAPTAAAGQPLALDAAAFELDFPVRVTPDGARVVYTRAVNGAGDLELRSAALDGSTATVTLHPPLPTGSGVKEFELGPGGTRVVYRAGSPADARFELFAVASDASAPPVRLHGPLAPGRSVDGFRISAPGRRVVFRGDLALENVVELWSVPLAGTQAPRKLSGPLVAGGDVADFALSPDGRSVVYRADQVADGRFDLFSAPVDAGKARRIGARSAAAIQLTALSGSRRAEADYAFTPDGAQVVFRANALVAADVELFRVPVNGSVAPVRLSAPPIGFGDVRSFAVAPDGSRVAYRADQRVLEVIELWSVPLAGGPAVLLDPLPGSADVSGFRIDPESERVIYLADRLTNDRDELFAMPLDASAAPVRLNRALAEEGEVQPDFLVLPGGRTLYRAQQDHEDALELYVALELGDATLPAARTREH